MKLVFYGLTAFVRSVSGKNIYFSTVNPTSNPHMFVPLDLDKTPSDAEAGTIAWGDVIVDDFGAMDQKFTTVAPWRGVRQGGVWVEERHLALLRRLHKLPLPNLTDYPGSRLYEFMSVRYYAEDQSGDAARLDKRYLGYHAEITDPATKTVKVWHAGTSGGAGGKAPVTIANLDFDDPDKVDYSKSRGGYTEIGVGAGEPQSGALFLKDSFAQSMILEGPKKPPSGGL